MTLVEALRNTSPRLQHGPDGLASSSCACKALAPRSHLGGQLEPHLVEIYTGWNSTAGATR